MIIPFADKDKIKEQLKNKSKDITIKFDENIRFKLTIEMINLITSIDKTDKKFIKKLLNSKSDFMFFIYQILNNLNK